MYMTSMPAGNVVRGVFFVLAILFVTDVRAPILSQRLNATEPVLLTYSETALFAHRKSLQSGRPIPPTIHL
jgi:hypothetical protein